MLSLNLGRRASRRQRLVAGRPRPLDAGNNAAKTAGRPYPGRAELEHARRAQPPSLAMPRAVYEAEWRRRTRWSTATQLRMKAGPRSAATCARTSAAGGTSAPTTGKCRRQAGGASAPTASDPPTNAARPWPRARLRPAPRTPLHLYRSRGDSAAETKSERFSTRRSPTRISRGCMSISSRAPGEPPVKSVRDRWSGLQSKAETLPCTGRSRDSRFYCTAAGTSAATA